MSGLATLAMHARAGIRKKWSFRSPVDQLTLRTPFELHKAEWALLAEHEPSSGSHIVTPHRGYMHHGIYIGGGRVVHYAGLASGLRGGPVEEISLARFTRGRPLWVRSNTPSSFDCREVVRRARSRVGEYGYRILSNNCEHFCEWCLRGEHRSYQVEAWLAHPVRTLRTTIRTVAQLRSLPGAIGMRSADSVAK